MKFSRKGGEKRIHNPQVLFRCHQQTGLLHLALSSIATAAAAATTRRQKGESTWKTAPVSTTPAGHGGQLGTARARWVPLVPPPHPEAVRTGGSVRLRPALPTQTVKEKGEEPESPKARHAATSASSMEEKKNKKKEKNKT